MTIETDTGVKTVEVYTTNGKVTSAAVDMGYELRYLHKLHHRALGSCNIASVA